MIMFEDVNKEYFLTRRKSILALKNINFSINKGDFVSIVGPSGSGKSTLLALASLLDKQTSGEIWIDGTKTSQLKDSERTNLRFKLFGMIFQFASLTPGVPLLENVMLPLLLRGEKRQHLEARALSLLQTVGIKEDYTSHLPYQLSGGEQRRVAVARALLKRPEVLFADEPTSALDAVTAKEITNLFQRLNQQGTTIIMVTHDRQLAKEGTSLLEIKDGELLKT
ncbi:ABC transporter ATP-binding protein [Anaerobacillus alkaliphilus]|uniref:ABC transporter ATP-binding protein n=1 Tax=Anaerobacillus alkaliphilus TaxID=1548597 RepID=A0A4Q0VQN4_9BACI|nr:ABC transporter ATP-binding protein [Anaerobacillus alkaliphilus]RXI98431.1 ABC transporter ATP-binding protein [Anaerobacillus alkaliphilus]